MFTDGDLVDARAAGPLPVPGGHLPGPDQHVRALPHHRSGRLLQPHRRLGDRPEAGRHRHRHPRRRQPPPPRAGRRRWPGRRGWSPTTCSCACPARSEEDFLILQPFVPFSRDDSRKDLTAFMVAKSDPSHYGRLEAFVMPRARQIDGPAIVNARINQQPEISQQITLLGTAGSNVKLGNLLVIPINQSLIYIQPLYVQAAGTPVPQLKKVIVVAGDRVVMRDSLREALDGAVRLVAAHARAPGRGGAHRPARDRRRRDPDGSAPATTAARGRRHRRRPPRPGQRPLHRRRRGPAGGRPGRVPTGAGRGQGPGAPGLRRRPGRRPRPPPPTPPRRPDATA